MAKTQTEGVAAPPKRPKNPNRRPDGVPKVLPFFDRVAQIPKEDWGTRATIKVYRMEPVINQLSVAENKYIALYGEDGLSVSEERIKQDHGSGKYRLYLNYKLPGEGEGKELDSLVLDILDYDYPPRMLPGTWIDHPRNRNWAWAKEKLLQQHPPAPPPPAAPTPLGEVAQTLDVLNRIQDTAIERNKATTPPPAQGTDTLSLLRGLKELMPPSSENGVFQSVVALMTAQMQQQTAIMQKQMDDARAEAKELRDDMRAMRNNPASQKSGFDMFKEGLGLLKEVGPSLKDIWPGVGKRVGEALDGGGRSRMSGWQEFLQPIFSDVLNSPVMNALGQLIILKATKEGMQTAQPGGAATPGTTAAQPQPAINGGRGPRTLVDFLNEIWPQLHRHLKDGIPGEDFAGLLYDWYGCPYNGLDWLAQIRNAGAANLIVAFKASPFWPQIAVLPNAEATFNEFVNGFVSFSPETAEQGQDGEVDEHEDDEVTDLTATV